MPVQSTDVAILGVDVGGTFTDAVLVEEGRIRTAKVPTAARQEESVLAAARAVGAGAGVTRFAHGTTVATNALLERRGARIAYVGNAGFEHLLHLRRQTRAHLYRLCAEHPEPLVPLERCHGVRGRLGPEGELEPLDLGSLPDVGDVGGDRRVPPVRVPRRLARAGGRRRAAAAHPGVHVVASHEVAPEFREYERASTTAADAYLAPVAARYLRALAAAAAEAGLAGAARDALLGRRRSGRGGRRASGDALLVSGPAGGVVGAGLVARRAGFENAIAFDMGGTSTDVCLLPGGGPRASPSASSAAFRSACRRSTCTRSARAAARSCGATRAARSGSGPSRRGPIPAPRATARRRPDRDRREPPARTAAGGAARRARARPRGGERALDGIDPAAVVDVVNAEMLRALRVVSVERGHDPREFALVAFGGAGPLHACALAEELGIEAVLVPAAAGVLSALGLVAGDERRDRVVSYVRPLARCATCPLTARPTCATAASRSS